jgi:GNAT superfamily N-acetyltransferase
MDDPPSYRQYRHGSSCLHHHPVGDIPKTMDGIELSRSLLVNDKILVIRRAAAEELIDLRHRVLRAGLPRELAIFLGDELPISRHFGAFDDQSIICCATFHLEPWQTEPAWRLRGMATDAGFRSKGIGRALLNFAEEMIINENPIRLFWCNARLPAARFYQSVDWKIASDVFEIPTAGPHYVMVKRLDR